MDCNKMTLYMGDLEPWMDENYLKQLWLSLGEVVNIKMIRDKVAGCNAGYCFVDFMSHSAAVKFLNTVNGKIVPGTNKVFRLNWASGTQNNNTPEYSVFVGDLGPEVTDMMLLQKFRSLYPNCKSAKVVTDPVTGASRGYGFVRFSDEMEQQRALAEMDGQYCGTRAMRISVATPKNKSAADSMSMKSMGYTNGMSGLMNSAQMRSAVNLAQGSIGQIAYQNQISMQAYNQFSDPHNTTVFVGGLSSQLTDNELRSYFSPFGDIVYTKIPLGKGCGFVQFVHRQSAEMAIRQMNGALICGSRVRLSWGRSQAAARNDYRPYPAYPVHQVSPVPTQYPTVPQQTPWMGYVPQQIPANVQQLAIAQSRPVPPVTPHVQDSTYQVPENVYYNFKQPNTARASFGSLDPLPIEHQNADIISAKASLMTRIDLVPLNILRPSTITT